MNVPVTEKNPRDPPRGSGRGSGFSGVVVAVVAILIFSVVNLIQRTRDSAKQSTTHTPVDAVVKNAQRTDCSRRYTALFTDIDREQRVAAAEGQTTLGRFLIGGPAITSAVLKDVGARLDKANTALKNLPATDDAVNNGFTLDGKTYPPARRLRRRRVGVHRPHDHQNEVQEVCSVRILTDLSTSEWFWFGVDDDRYLTAVDSDSYSNETYAREAAAEYLHVEPDEVVVAEENPAPDEPEPAGKD